MNPLMGRWTGNKEVLVFGDKKHFEYDDMKGTWFTRGQYLTMDVKSRIGQMVKVKRKFKLDGDRLEIEDDDGGFIKYRRSKKK